MSDHIEQITSIKDKYQITYKQAAFCYYFTGNATDACRRAGYKGTAATLSVQGNRLLKNSKIKTVLQDRTAGDHAGILSPNDLLVHWSRVVSDPDSSPADKAKAADSLAKSHAMFTDKQISLNYTKTDRLDQLTDNELTSLLQQIISDLTGQGQITAVQADQITGPDHSEDHQ
jgi:hypothetical protein